MGDLIGSSSLSAVVFSYVLVSFYNMTTVKTYGRGSTTTFCALQMGMSVKT
jgi:hypothetical protein